ncbi:MAG: DUF4038 domain-containing protein [Verrucomicrobiota bacterium]|nr:DUF4038 domain-containing protein [Verrucomicrobiota bacterium]
MKLSIAPTKTYFIKKNGEPFFFLADTAWNAALHSDTDGWELYCSTRAAQGFTVIQFVASIWRGCKTPRHGRLFEEIDGAVVYDENAWRKMDEFIRIMVKHGLVPAPVMVWKNNPDEAIFKFKEETCIAAGKRMVTEWSKYNPLWILGGDGDYRNADEVRYWKTVGRGIFSDTDNTLVTMHPGGSTWICDNFKDEPWYTFAAIQSGHGSNDYDLNFLLNGPYTTRWRDLQMPLINMECNYEFAKSYHEDLFYTAYHVRRGSWWSLLGAPTAGITYGSNTIWVWPMGDHEHAEGHGEGWPADNWKTGLDTEGVRNMQTTRQILEQLPWQDLKPAPQVIDEQRGWGDLRKFCKAAATDSMETILIYLPRQVYDIKLSGAQITPEYEAFWINPRTGGKHPAKFDRTQNSVIARCPSHEDWLLLCQRY